MKREYHFFVEDMLSSINAVEDFVKGMTFDEFINDDKTASAVIRKFEIIGEAAKHIPPAVREKYGSIPWKSVVGLRDRLTHAYFGVDHKLVWGLIETELPKLRKVLKEMLAAMVADNAS